MNSLKYDSPGRADSSVAAGSCTDPGDHLNVGAKGTTSPARFCYQEATEPRILLLTDRAGNGRRCRTPGRSPHVEMVSRRTMPMKMGDRNSSRLPTSSVPSVRPSGSRSAETVPVAARLDRAMCLLFTAHYVGKITPRSQARMTMMIPIGISQSMCSHAPTHITSSPSRRKATTSDDIERRM